jgi:serine O-acetyltransferase
MQKNIKNDLYRYGGLSGLKGLIIGYFIPGFRYTYYLRKSQKYSNRSLLGIYYRLILRKLSFRYGIQIPANTKIGCGFYIGHFGNIIVSPKALIGNNCNISQGVTIGIVQNGKLKGAPSIGDLVWIGANSMIVGNIIIGNNVVIAPGTFVNFDVPDNSIVIGQKAKIIERNNPTEDKINFIDYI